MELPATIHLQIQMIYLITKAVVASKLQVAIGYDSLEFNTFINEAQEFDFKPLVSEDFYYDLLSKRNDPTWKKLIDGGDYEHEGRMYSFQGIASVISYFTYARYYLDSPGIATSHGIVFKITPTSTPVPLEDRRNTYYKKRENANALFTDCVKFIERNIGDFSSWNNGNICSKPSNGPTKTRVIQ